MLRTTITVTRPANPGPGSSYYAETWRVYVEQEKHPGGWAFKVTGMLLAEHIPQQWDSEKRVWIEAYDREIPGVILGPETLPSLAAARKRAGSMADVLCGQLYPNWKPVHFDKHGNGNVEK